MDSRERDAASGTPGPRPRIVCLVTGMIEANCYLVLCPTTRATLVIDPGANPELIAARLAELEARVVRVLHTHGHFDHIGATEAVLAALPERVPLAAHPADGYLYTPQARAAGAPYGYPVPERTVLPDEELHDGDEVRVGELRLEVIATPGHTPGSISLRCGDWCVFTGDTLFQRGIGRTDLPGGDEDAIYESILTRLYPLPGELRVYPGHGPETTIGQERRSNPFVQGEGAS